jgi:hypothetical protein
LCCSGALSDNCLHFVLLVNQNEDAGSCLTEHFNNTSRHRLCQWQLGYKMPSCCRVQVLHAAAA